ncbi:MULTISPECIES: multidrug efflux SMR transporter [Virgibacillus]|uniref:DMT family transporter n=1 Tax=Virgibacillus TaxID=84406 RepID=UPI0003FCEAC6|nr:MULTISPECIES: multidrug efflux SMR transporter [Bacillaceae]MDY7043088.1 multidrug efflux SMR transporter [Virgibacillus sp. M23]WBX79841.1 multidrug efflux SMR transporter [Virgibacillus salarius]
MKGYVMLAISIISEVCGTTMLKISDGFSNPLPSFGVVVSFASAFYFLSICLKTVALSLAYAIWAGIGTALTALIGILIWNEPFSFLTVVGLIFIIGGVVLLNMPNNQEDKVLHPSS